jgi:hypothetical protein
MYVCMYVCNMYVYAITLWLSFEAFLDMTCIWEKELNTLDWLKIDKSSFA